MKFFFLLLFTYPLFILFASPGKEALIPIPTFNLQKSTATNLVQQTHNENQTLPNLSQRHQINYLSVNPLFYDGISQMIMSYLNSRELSCVALTCRRLFKNVKKFHGSRFFKASLSIQGNNVSIVKPSLTMIDFQPNKIQRLAIRLQSITKNGETLALQISKEYPNVTEFHFLLFPDHLNVKDEFSYFAQLEASAKFINFLLTNYSKKENLFKLKFSHDYPNNIESVKDFLKQKIKFILEKHSDHAVALELPIGIADVLATLKKPLGGIEKVSINFKKEQNKRELSAKAKDIGIQLIQAMNHNLFPSLKGLPEFIGLEFENFPVTYNAEFYRQTRDLMKNIIKDNKLPKLQAIDLNKKNYFAQIMGYALNTEQIEIQNLFSLSISRRAALNLAPFVDHKHLSKGIKQFSILIDNRFDYRDSDSVIEFINHSIFSQLESLCINNETNIFINCLNVFAISLCHTISKCPFLKKVTLTSENGFFLKVFFKEYLKASSENENLNRVNVKLVLLESPISGDLSKAALLLTYFSKIKGLNINLNSFLCHDLVNYFDELIASSSEYKKMKIILNSDKVVFGTFIEHFNKQGKLLLPAKAWLRYFKEIEEGNITPHTSFIFQPKVFTFRFYPYFIMVFQKALDKRKLVDTRTILAIDGATERSNQSVIFFSQDFFNLLKKEKLTGKLPSLLYLSICEDYNSYNHKFL